MIAKLACAFRKASWPIVSGCSNGKPREAVFSRPLFAFRRQLGDDRRAGAYRHPDWFAGADAGAQRGRSSTPIASGRDHLGIVGGFSPESVDCSIVLLLHSNSHQY
jgi:hypothetical protein